MSVNCWTPPKGNGQKSDYVKANESHAMGWVHAEVLSACDRGCDFVKAGETPVRKPGHGYNENTS